MLLRDLRPFPILIAILFSTTFSPIARASGVVSACDETHLNTALSGGGLVTFSGDCTITVTGTKTISANTTIDGSGHKVVLDGGGATRILFVDSGVTLSLNELTIQNGNESSGGAGGVVSDGGTLIVTNSTFYHNKAQSGAAIQCNGFSPLTAKHDLDGEYRR